MTQRKNRGHRHPPVTAVVGNPGRDLDHPAYDPFDGSFYFFALHIKLKKNLKQAVSQYPHFQSNPNSLEPVLTRPVPAKRILALLDSILHISSTVVGFDHLFGYQSEAGHEEAHPGEKLALMPFN
jgi:hypothetical protein